MYILNLQLETIDNHWEAPFGSHNYSIVLQKLYLKFDLVHVDHYHNIELLFHILEKRTDYP